MPNSVERLPVLATSAPTPSRQSTLLVMVGILVIAIVLIAGFMILGAVRSPQSAPLILTGCGSIITALIALTGIVVKAYLDTAKDIEVIKKDVNSQMTELLRVKAELAATKELAAEARGRLAGVAEGREQQQKEEPQ